MANWSVINVMAQRNNKRNKLKQNGNTLDHSPWWQQERVATERKLKQQ